MIRIIHITNAHSVDDPRIFSRHCTSLVNHGFDVIYIGPFGIINKLHQGVKVIGVKKTKSRLVRFTVVNYRIFIQIIKLRPNVVEFHDPDLVLLASFLRVIGIKVVGNIHEDIVLQVLNKYWIAKIFRLALHKLLGFFYPKFVNVICNGIVCATDGISRNFQQKNNIVCRNFTTKNFFYKQNTLSRDINPKKLNLVYVGVIEERRGLDIMLEISKSNLVSSLTLVGKFSPVDLRAEVESLVTVNNKINIVGEVPYQEVASYIEKSDVGICFLENNPAYSESLPTKIFEYASLGLPTITNNFKYISDLNNIKRFAILVDDINSNSIEDAFKKIIEKYSFYSTSSIEASKFFSWNNEESKYIDLINNVV